MLILNIFLYRFVSNRLNEIDETAASSSTEVVDIDMVEDELLEKFSVQGMTTGKNSGKTKIVRNIFLSYHQTKLNLM